MRTAMNQTFLSFTEDTIATETNETSEDTKDTPNEGTHIPEDDGNAKEEAVAAPIETSSEPARGLGLYNVQRKMKFYSEYD